MYVIENNRNQNQENFGRLNLFCGREDDKAFGSKIFGTMILLVFLLCVVAYFGELYLLFYGSIN